MQLRICFLTTTIAPLRICRVLGAPGLTLRRWILQRFEIFLLSFGIPALGGRCLGFCRLLRRCRCGLGRSLNLRALPLFAWRRSAPLCHFFLLPHLSAPHRSANVGQIEIPPAPPEEYKARKWAPRDARCQSQRRQAATENHHPAWPVR